MTKWATKDKQCCQVDVWLTTKELSMLEGVSLNTINKRCQSWKYTRLRKVTGHGGGKKGMVWLININDPAISNKIRERFYIKKIIDVALTHSFIPKLNKIEKQLQELIESLHKWMKN